MAKLARNCAVELRPPRRQGRYAALLARGYLRVRAMQKAAAAKEDAGGRSRRPGFQEIAARRHDVFSHGSCWARTVGETRACSSTLMAEFRERS